MGKLARLVGWPVAAAASANGGWVGEFFFFFFFFFFFYKNFFYRIELWSVDPVYMGVNSTLQRARQACQTVTGGLRSVTGRSSTRQPFAKGGGAVRA